MSRLMDCASVQPNSRAGKLSSSMSVLTIANVKLYLNNQFVRQEGAARHERVLHGRVISSGRFRMARATAGQPCFFWSSESSRTSSGKGARASAPA